MKRVRAITFKQKSTTLYCFAMSAMELEPLRYVEAATRDNKKSLQRVTEPGRLREIAEYLNSGERAILPNNIILNLAPEVAIENEGDGLATLVFPSSEGDFAFVVDGQHRLFSFEDEYRELPVTESFELPVVALHNATEEMVGQTFVEINVNQKPVNKDLLTQMKAILGLLDIDFENTAIELIHALDEDKQSPLYSRILRFPKERNKWIKVNQLLPVIIRRQLCSGEKRGPKVGKTKRGKGTKIMVVADRNGLPVSICVESATPHEDWRFPPLSRW